MEHWIRWPSASTRFGMPIGARRVAAWALAAFVVAGAATPARFVLADGASPAVTNARQGTETASPVASPTASEAPDTTGPSATVGQVTAVGLFPDVTIGGALNAVL